MRGNSIGSNDCKQALLNLFSGKIKYLDLTDNGLGCGDDAKLEDWVDFFDTLQKNKSLESLNLTNCALDILILLEEEKGKNIFSEQLLMFIKHTSLKELNLSKNDFEENYTIKLIEAANENPGLKLVCEGNGLSKEAIAALTQTLKERSQPAAGNPVSSSIKAPLTFSDPLKAVESRDNSLVVSQQRVLRGSPEIAHS